MLSTSRDEHLQFAIARAQEYVDRGDLPGAMASLASDLLKHEETAGHGGIDLGYRLLFTGHLRTAPEMREFILGFRLTT